MNKYNRYKVVMPKRVYVGAVMVLFLFVIKMLNIDKSTLRAKFAGYLPLGLLVAAVIVTNNSTAANSNE
jgi:NADH-quinone oxidoreductase subunit J